jgi:hypothetical protein
VSADPEVAEALAAIGVFATPLLLVSNAKVMGFHPEVLHSLLTINRESGS